MKLCNALAILSTSITVSAHYTLPDLIVNGTTSTDWQYVRITENHYSNGPITDVTDEEFRCYELDMQNTPEQTSTATVAAGSTVGFKADNTMGTGKTWFKIWEWAPTYSPSTGLTFDSENIQQFTFTIPRTCQAANSCCGESKSPCTVVAETYGGAQFYLGCAQLNVVNGGSGSPSPLVSIPGVYTGYEPGILINIYDLPSNFTGYVSPGPAVWSG
ncbi:hypothetical protein PUNSTDRAFT_154791 [Punctularia strigosozonata HHB-11173 SS5]|uniref:uncharacterized protein n=1 Tax=Punctularia strigosozonata (strain HHB-11173) TaxID=741275 RepID=UPI0004416ACE|nr:uncharacterized protein PUNSTDRAFT_154791 [Punctularia strigosozonata HHB-11173 SS5]EIN14756.1 hypothetical protein PUNSTDRAFT_154791 [Punctularia strigosozonata HHB-11173 SS5]